MPRSRSIRRSIILFIVATSSVLVVSYSIMMGYYMVRGLDLSTQFRLKDEAANYAERYQLDPDTPLPRSSHLNAYSDYASLPQIVRDEFTEAELQAGDVLECESDGAHYFTHAYERRDGRTVYFVFHFLEDEMPEQAGRRFRIYFFYAPATVGFLTILVVFGLAVFLLRRVARPVEDLYEWAFSLSLDTVDNRAPDFKYEELIELGELFHKALVRLSAGIEREKRFQKFASHELRTPIAVLQNNLELLERLGIREDSRFVPSFTRMDKAVKNMRHLTTTLLWVSREEDILLPDDTIALDKLVNEIIDENSYLLVGKDISLDTSLDRVTVMAPTTVVRIIISNIIRNAFQHAYEGEIVIALEAGLIQVANEINPNARNGKTECHGLGLQLITQTTERLGWELKRSEHAGKFLITLMFPVAQSDPESE